MFFCLKAKVLNERFSYFQVYELVLHFCMHPDHNVVTATLETLYQLLKCAPKELQQVLVSPYGILKSSIFDIPKLNRAMSDSNYISIS